MACCISPRVIERQGPDGILQHSKRAAATQPRIPGAVGGRPAARPVAPRHHASGHRQTRVPNGTPSATRPRCAGGSERSPTQTGESGARASTPGGKVPAAFQTLVLAAFSLRRAWYRRRCSKRRCSARAWSAVPGRARCVQPELRFLGSLNRNCMLEASTLNMARAARWLPYSRAPLDKGRCVGQARRQRKRTWQFFLDPGSGTIGW